MLQLIRGPRKVNQQNKQSKNKDSKFLKLVLRYGKIRQMTYNLKLTF